MVSSNVRIEVAHSLARRASMHIIPLTLYSTSFVQPCSTVARNLCGINIFEKTILVDSRMRG